MLTNSQKEILESFVGDEGIYFDTINEAESAGFDLGTKILYLERAINQDCQSFLQSLDKLYNSNEDNIELIRALKTINDLCFNNEVKVGEYGIKKALNHYFNGLDNELDPLCPDEFKTAIQKIINDRIDILKENKENTIIAKKQAREENEKSIVRQTGWRGTDKLNLPLAQQVERPPGLEANRFFNEQRNIAEQEAPVNPHGIESFFAFLEVHEEADRDQEEDYVAEVEALRDQEEAYQAPRFNILNLLRNFPFGG